MPNWIHELQRQLKDSALATLVTVIGTQGSVPREVGARMIVTSSKQWGTIGGGHLEYSVVKQARARQLANNRQPGRQKFALGPSLGQCCGGMVEVLFETMTCETQLPEASFDKLCCRRIDENSDGHFIGLSSLPELMHQSLATADLVSPVTVIECDDQVWLVEKPLSRQPIVVVFGAGHVGQAVVAQLALLPCSIVWVDERDDWFPSVSMPSVQTVQTDWPEQEVNDLPDDAWFVVMTHSHATDFNICLALLEKQRFSFLGLIGSETKRNTFKKRLVQRGIEEKTLDRLCCPIGLAEINSSRPASIALGLAAQLAQLWEASNSD